MGSGKPLTEQEVYSIHRMASYKDADGHWQFSVAEIAHRLKHDEATVSRYIREGCRCWHHVSRWKADSSIEP
jgi:IS30 family transposase